MRNLGYMPEGLDERTGELRFSKSLSGGRYPKFHIYASTTDKEAILNLHLDQKQVSYEGSSAHSGEYDGAVVEQEAKRILNLI